MTAYQDRLDQLMQQEKTLGDKLVEQQQIAENLRTQDREAVLSTAGTGQAGVGNLLSALSGLQKASYGTSALNDAYKTTRGETNELLKLLGQQEFQTAENEKQRQHELNLKGLSVDENGNVVGGGATSIDDLLKTRASIAEQGGDTKPVDEQLRALGIDMGKATSVDDTAARTLSMAYQLQNMGSKAHGITSPGFLFGRTGKGDWGTADYTKAKALYDSMIGNLQLKYSQAMKGQGQISDKERAIIAAAANAGLTRNLSNEDFDQALDRFINEIETTSGLDQEKVSNYIGTSYGDNERSKIVNSNGQPISDFNN
ncbi:MAG: hypothetical protein Q4G02_03440 [bacterium]|nr:hypothetical protein [bacterium]